MSILILTEETMLRIRELSALAQANPVKMPPLMEALKSAQGKARHLEQMTRQSIPIPVNYFVTFSIEEDHPCGTCRHMSMSIQGSEKLPSPEAVWGIATEFGFWKNLQRCALWIEELQGHGKAVNIVQPLVEG